MGLSHLPSMCSLSKRKKCSNTLSHRLESGHWTGDTEQTPEAPGVRFELCCSVVWTSWHHAHSPLHVERCLNLLCYLEPKDRAGRVLQGARWAWQSRCRSRYLRSAEQRAPASCPRLKTHSEASFMIRKEPNENEVRSDLLGDNESTVGCTPQILSAVRGQKNRYS